MASSPVTLPSVTDGTAAQTAPAGANPPAANPDPGASDPAADPAGEAQPGASGTEESSGDTDPNSAVNSLALNQNLAYLGVGETMHLGALVDPAGVSVRWSTSNNAVASVTANGVVTAKGAGTVVISATAGSFSAFCSLTVTDDGAPNLDWQDVTGAHN
jgi:uncharacterized protein YjdB